MHCSTEAMRYKFTTIKRQNDEWVFCEKTDKMA